MTGGISNQQWRQILGVFAKHPNIHEIILYGSRAKGNFREGSDIDLALKGDKITSRQITQIGLDYENLYLPWKLDVIVDADHIHSIGKKLK